MGLCISHCHIIMTDNLRGKIIDIYIVIEIVICNDFTLIPSCVFDPKNVTVNYLPLAAYSLL